MERGQEISRVVNELWTHLVKKRQLSDWTFEELQAILLRNLEFLRSFPEYSELLNALPQDFVHLPNEIIHDVVAVATQDQSAAKSDLEFFAQIKGPWAEFSRQTIEELDSVFIYRNSEFFRENEFLVNTDCELSSCEEAQSHFISDAVIRENVVFDELRAVAPKLYNSIEFTNVADIPSDIIAQIGDRFSSVEWAIPVAGDEETRVQNYMTPQIIGFLKRQLRSKHLKKLFIAATGLQGELNDLLVNFVKKPHFRCLELYESAVDRVVNTARAYPLPFNLITAAFEAWNSRIFFEVGWQRIGGTVSDETVKKLADYFQTTCDHFGYHPRLELTRFHNTHQSAKMELAVGKDVKSCLALTFSGMPIRNTVVNEQSL